MESFDFEQLSKDLNNVNTAVASVNHISQLLATVQQTALNNVSALARVFQQMQAELEEKTNRVNELEAMLKAITEKEVQNAE